MSTDQTLHPQRAPRWIERPSFRWTMIPGFWAFLLLLAVGSSFILDDT